MNWYDRKGSLLDIMEAGVLFSDLEYKIVARDEFPGGITISTVWLGLDHRFMPKEGDSPIIFETIVFDRDRSELDMERYSTEEEALEGHRNMVNKWRTKAQFSSL